MMDKELLQLAADLRAGFHAALSYVVDPDENDDWAELTEDAIRDRLCKAHRAADRLTQIERERAGQQRLDGFDTPEIYNALGSLADAITPRNAIPRDDASGTGVGSLTESVMGMTRALCDIGHAINRLAEAVEDHP